MSIYNAKNEIILLTRQKICKMRDFITYNINNINIKKTRFNFKKC